MATIPKLFSNAAKRSIQQDQLDWLITKAAIASARIDSILHTNTVLTATPRILQLALLTPVVLVIAALVRSVFTANARPFGVTILGFLTGVMTIPAVAAIVVASITAVRFLVRLSKSLTEILRRFFLWIAPVLSVVVKIVAAIAVLAAIIAIVKWIITEGLIVIVGTTIMVGALLAWAIHAGYLHVVYLWLQSFANWLDGIGQAISRFLARYLTPIIGWLISALTILVVALFTIGTIGGIILQAGRTVILPLLDARGTWIDRTKCINVSVGIGLSLSLILTGAVCDEGFARFLDGLWNSTPVLKYSPSIVGVYDTLLVQSGETVFTGAFNPYSCVMDATLIGLTGIVASVSLFVSKRNSWTTDNQANIGSLVLLSAGAGLALIIPATVLTLWANSQNS